MRLYGYEWRKLLTRGRFWVLALLLLAGNLALAWASQRYSSSYFYVFQQRDAYLAYCQGDESADSSGYYALERQTQEEYLTSYQTFLAEMEGRAARMSQTSLYNDSGSFLSRNLAKTCQDFARLSGLTFSVDNCYGLRGLAEYDYGVWFLLVFLGLMTYFLLFQERNSNLLLLLKGSRRGHFPLAGAKLGALFTGAAVYTLLQEGSTVALFGWLYGYGNLSRPIQAISLFRNCDLSLTVGQGLAAIVLIRVGIALFLGAVLYCVGMSVRNEGGCVLFSAALLGTEAALNLALSLNGSLSGLKCVNPFYCWGMDEVLGEYLNLNLLGYAVNKRVCQLAAGLLLVVALSLWGLWIFHRTCQMRSEGVFERLMQRLRRRFSGLSHRTGLLFYEFYKLLFQQKRGLVVLALLAFCVYSIAGVYSPQYYASSQAAAYHAYAVQYAGPITQETLDALDAEQTRLNGLWEQIEAYGSSASGADQLNQELLQLELDRLESGFEQLREQVDELLAMDGPMEEKYLVDEDAYTALWSNTGYEVLLWFAGSVALLLLVCSIYTMDEQEQVRLLLRSTRLGREELARSKDRAALLCTLLACLTMELPLFLAYAQVDDFATAGQKLCYLVSWGCTGSMTIGTLEALTFALKAVSFFLTALLGRGLAKGLKQELPALLASAGVTGMAVLLFLRLGWSIHYLLLMAEM